MTPKALRKCCRPKIKIKRKAVFDIGFSELLLIAVAGIVVIGPKDLPVVVRHVAKFLRELRGLYAGIKNQMTQLADEAGINARFSVDGGFERRAQFTVAQKQQRNPRALGSR